MMNKKIIIVSALTILLLPSLVVAIDPAQWFNDIISRLLDYIVWPIFAGLSVIMFIWAGILFLTAHGDPSKITGARKAFLWGVIGIALGLSALSIPVIIKNILGPI